MMKALEGFREVWLVDFEFHAPAGERPRPLCLVAREWRSGRLIRLWEDELLALQGPPFSIDTDVLLVAYYASAELSCYLSLGWHMPARVLDLCVEFKWLTSGLQVSCGKGLLGAMLHFGFDAIAVEEKNSMRELAMSGGPFNSKGPTCATGLLSK